MERKATLIAAVSLAVLLLFLWAPWIDDQKLHDVAIAVKAPRECIHIRSSVNNGNRAG